MIWSDVLLQWYDTRRIEAILEAPTHSNRPIKMETAPAAGDVTVLRASSTSSWSSDSRTTLLILTTSVRTQLMYVTSLTNEPSRRSKKTDYWSNLCRACADDTLTGLDILCYITGWSPGDLFTNGRTTVFLRTPVARHRDHTVCYSRSAAHVGLA